MKQRQRNGLSLIELVWVMAMVAILVLVTGVLLVSTQKAFGGVYQSIHDPSVEDTKALAAAFGAITRKSNRTNYVVYKINGTSYTEAAPASGQSIAYGQAIELRYWGRPFYELSQTMDEMEVTDTGSRYALFYLSGDKLYLDHGDVVNGVGGIDGGTRQTNNIVTQCLVRKVDTSQNTDIFSHEIIGGSGNGCVSLNLTVTNDGGETVDVKMASLIRVVWPR